MPVKTHKTSHKKHPKHYAKVYWPYIPLVLVVGLALWLSYPAVSRSQRGVLSYKTDITGTSLLSETNSQRVASKQRELALNPQLSQAAQAKAEDMVRRNYWSHVTPEGQAPWVFIDQTGYSYQSAAENLAYGFNNSSETIKGWLNSPEHRVNLLGPQYSEVGFGIVEAPNYLGTGPETVVVALYGKPAAAGQSASVLGDNTVLAASSKTISKAQTLTNGSLPWVGLILGSLIGIGAAFLLLKHSVAVHRAVRKGERFVLKHPVWDATIIAVIALCAILGQSVGSVL